MAGKRREADSGQTHPMQRRRLRYSLDFASWSSHVCESKCSMCDLSRNCSWSEEGSEERSPRARSVTRGWIYRVSSGKRGCRPREGKNNLDRPRMTRIHTFWLNLDQFFRREQRKSNWILFLLDETAAGPRKMLGKAGRRLGAETKCRQGQGAKALGSARAKRLE